MSALSNAKSEVADASSGLPSYFYDNLERRLVRKIDLHVSVIMVLYALNYIDRANISSARLAGFEKDLHLHGSQYATILSISYVEFIVMPVPAEVVSFVEGKNMFLHWLERPAILLPFCMVTWGLLSTSTGFYTGALFCRLFLDFAEAPFFSGSIFLLSRWCRPDELAVRMILIICGSMISAGFGSLFASGILTGMQGQLGQASWKRETWFFHIEGGITIIVAICAMFILPNFPHNTRWLTPEERSLAISRLADDGYRRMDESGKRTTMQGLRNALSDWKV
ncbi:major facilitator superfamily domain-containing protein [Suillus spraguei]|nr:major facilitator superfamily domain-containing protein [Suillus spraguei]